MEVNEFRYQVLCKTIKATGASCVKTIHKDALTLKSDEYSNVEYVLVDPSCTGSGRLLLHDYKRVGIFHRDFNKFFCHRYVGQTESVWQREIRHKTP